MVFFVHLEGEVYIDKNLNAENVEFADDQSESKIFQSSKQLADTEEYLRVPLRILL